MYIEKFETLEVKFKIAEDNSSSFDSYRTKMKEQLEKITSELSESERKRIALEGDVQVITAERDQANRHVAEGSVGVALKLDEQKAALSKKHKKAIKELNHRIHSTSITYLI